MNDLKESIDKLVRKSYWLGVRDGLIRFAWWKDGTQYVGTCGKTLSEALESIDENAPIPRNLEP